jgi:hypothetical protein
MPIPIFKRLNEGWNADPNVPDGKVAVSGDMVRLSFFLNPYEFDAFEGEMGALAFEHCSMWRLGPTNDEGWYMGQCRYSRTAPAWGEFYELSGEDDQRLTPADWHQFVPTPLNRRHFLFYLRDNTFECFAADWRFERDRHCVRR